MNSLRFFTFLTCFCGGVCFLGAHAQPCTNDTVRPHAMWYNDTTIAQMPIPCMPDTCISCDNSIWLEMPDTPGIFAVQALVGQTIRVQFYDGCHYLLKDTCATFAFSPVIALEIFGDWRQKDYTVRICAAPSAGLQLMFKPGPFKNEILQDTLYLIDTLCGPLQWVDFIRSVSHECEWQEYNFAGKVGIVAQKPLTLGNYFCSGCGRKILIRE